jgi:integrase
LGKVSKRDAEAVRLKVESLLSAKITGSGVIDRETSIWLTKIDPKLRAKLVRAGLVEPLPEEVKSPTVADFTQEFIDTVAGNNRRKPGTRAQWEQVRTILVRLLPAGLRLHEVTKGHAKDYHEKLKVGRASLTVQKHVRISRQMFQWAVDFERLEVNPFAGIKVSAAIPRHNVEVSRSDIEAVIAVCDIPWKTIAALSRYGGLRCPSEVLSLEWSHVDFKAGRLYIPEPKVEHHEHRGIRECPIFPELRAVLDEAFAARKSETERYVVNKPAYRLAANTGVGWRNCNLRTKFLKRLKKAGVKPWPRLFHSMRATRQTELEKEFPLHVVCAWLGNSVKVARASYLLVTAADFEKAQKAAQ